MYTKTTQYSVVLWHQPQQLCQLLKYRWLKLELKEKLAFPEDVLLLA
jgi:hypothetical protein